MTYEVMDCICLLLDTAREGIADGRELVPIGRNADRKLKGNGKEEYGSA
jgi:hypothetical protein